MALLQIPMHARLGERGEEGSVQEWYKSGGTRVVVQEWWYKSGGTRVVVQEWYKSGTSVVQEWYKSGASGTSVSVKETFLEVPVR
jgi:uncharacterized protein YodC (DUF2158 family)